MMKRQRIVEELSIFVVLILLILTSGCATSGMRMYTGEELPKEQVAVIEGTTRFLYLVFGYICVSVKISQVDDKVPFHPVHKCEVLPGLHTVAVTVFREGGFLLDFEPISRSISLEFNAEAGHHYKIKAGYTASTVVNVIDIESGEIVAEVIPNE
jgi:hypothetical protein